ncbi:magnesium/cobalt transporter CorA [Planctomicrobium piriforme]|uniref:Magnesium transport protein CorA n=1 Tax=Planctomicrobium piriforme TaxID=1576369 RepID=A0A1I3D6K4_9PLAN|nr:magnesium/cobalt transporter CorA [Planctomicrobium piriforme]SFH82316.1 magnesium transporter [Planctomicrobium piriforme]
MNITPPIYKRLARKYFHRRTAPGAAPGTLVSDKSKHPTTMRTMTYGSGQLVEQKIEQLDQLPKPHDGQVVWLDITGLADAPIIEAIGKTYSLHPLALEDVLHVHQRAKVDEYGNVLFVVARMLYDDRPLDSEQVSLFLAKNMVITFQEDPGDCFDIVRERIRQGGRICARGPDYLVYALIDAIIDAYFPRLESLGTDLDDIDAQITASRGRHSLSRLHEIRRILIFLRKLLWQHRDALNVLVRQENELIAPDTHVYLRDCLDHVVQLLDVAETDRDSCIGLQELALAEIGQRTNDVMRVLTLITTVFMPLTLIAGIYGMNFDPNSSPLNMPELRWFFGYPFALSLMSILAVIMLGFFWARGWFHR